MRTAKEVDQDAKVCQDIVEATIDLMHDEGTEQLKPKSLPRVNKQNATKGRTVRIVYENRIGASLGHSLFRSQW